RHPGAEPGDAGEPAHRRGRVLVALDAAQGAVAGEDPAPFEEPPDVDDGPGQTFVFQPLWMATSPPRIGSALVWVKPAPAIIVRNASIGGKRRIDSTR
ncbi:MAG: hypothetical protein QOE79_1611, partial [Sphingomonadales bacterium]|nr:hypothetical protein [Sphingomonadales bacterium]